MTPEELRETVANIHERIAHDVPELQNCVVHCPKCGNEQAVYGVYCLAYGWPLCCGATMFLGKEP